MNTRFSEKRRLTCIGFLVLRIKRVPLNFYFITYCSINHFEGCFLVQCHSIKKCIHYRLSPCTYSTYGSSRASYLLSYFSICLLASNHLLYVGLWHSHSIPSKLFFSYSRINFASVINLSAHDCTKLGELLQK